MSPYPEYPLPADEESRLQALERILLLDSDSDPNLDRIVCLASQIFHTPIALISLVDRERQWFLSRIGLEASETPREMAFCAHAIAGDGVLVVPDASLDSRFDTNPLVCGEPGIRFYAGAPLTDSGGHKLGTLCVIDRVPHPFDGEQRHLLEMLSAQVVRELELRRQAAHCPQTGLFNRASFLRLGQKEFERARRTHGSLSLLTLLIEPTPPAEDAPAEPEGDRTLNRTADLCRRLSNPDDLLGRLGPWELGLLLIDHGGERGPDIAGAVLAGGPTLEEPSDAPPSDTPPRQASLRIGISRLQGRDEGFSDLLIRSDNALCLAAPQAVIIL